MTKSVNFRLMASRWRSSSKRRLADAGVPVELPSIDEVAGYLSHQPLRCNYCQRGLSLDVKSRRPEMDHSLPVSRGGTAATDNLVLTCHGCNAAKGPLTGQEYRSLLALVDTWDPGAAASLLSRLRGAFWCYRPTSDFRVRAISSAFEPLEVPQAQDAKIDVPWPL